jgi:hypothetical protein
VTHTCNPSYSGGKIRRIAVQSQPGKISERPYLEKTLYKKVQVEWLKM